MILYIFVQDAKSSVLLFAIGNCIELLLKRGTAVGVAMTPPPQLLTNLLQFRKAPSTFQCAAIRYLSVVAVILPGSVKAHLGYLCDWALEGVWCDHTHLSKVRAWLTTTLH